GQQLKKLESEYLELIMLRSEPNEMYSSNEMDDMLYDKRKEIVDFISMSSIVQLTSNKKIDGVTETEKTEAIKICNSFSQLETAIKKHAPFISNSRGVSIEWDSDKLISRIFTVIDGYPPTNVTRANGLRDKVIELCSRKIENHFL
ncbi:MAG: hypothetical protein AABY22_29995, partial [Nanoarchaeota archaeon]